VSLADSSAMVLLEYRDNKLTVYQAGFLEYCFPLMVRYNSARACASVRERSGASNKYNNT